MTNKRIEKFKEKNKQFKVYKGAWNSDFSKITYWFQDKTRMTISSEDSKYIRPTWIGKGQQMEKPKLRLIPAKR